MTSRIKFPTADELDTKGLGDDYRRILYLIPAAETEDGIPEVTYHAGVGNIGTPMRYHHNRWGWIGRYHGGVVGSSVRDLLESLEPELVELSACYEGTTWDGSNYRGSWTERAYDLQAVIDERASEPDRYSHYWTADDWYGQAGTDWADLCTEAKVDPERALGDDWQSVAAEVADAVEKLQDAPVSGTEDYVLAQAEDYRDQYARCECGKITGERCSHVQPEDDMVAVEWMPPHLRASHEAAGNRGTYPANGAERLWVTADCAHDVCDDEWTTEVEW